MKTTKTIFSFTWKLSIHRICLPETQLGPHLFLILGTWSRASRLVPDPAGGRTNCVAFLQPWDLHRKHLLFTIWTKYIQTTYEYVVTSMRCAAKKKNIAHCLQLSMDPLTPLPRTVQGFSWWRWYLILQVVWSNPPNLKTAAKHLMKTLEFRDDIYIYCICILYI